MKYVQCVLRKSLGLGGNTEQTTFVPEKFAVLGDTLKLRKGAGQWDDGWTVMRVGQVVEKDALDTQWFRRTRRHSDI